LALALQVNAVTLLNPAFDVRTVIPNVAIHSLTFTPNGDLYTNNGGSQICRYPNAVNLPIGKTLSPSANGTCYPSAGPGNYGTDIVSSKTGKLYTVTGYEVDPLTGVRTSKFNNCGATHGLAIDPRDGGLFFSNVGGTIWRIDDPDLTPGYINTNCAAAIFVSNGALAVDGITVGPDGKLYGAGMSNRFFIFSPYSPATPQATVIANVPATNVRPDGISICIGSGNSFALVGTTSGSIAKFNLTGPGGAPTYAESLVATNVGGYLDFTTVDPKGCIWGSDLAGSVGPYRVTNADGSCSCASAQVPTPPPSTGGCPNCSTVVTEANPGSADFLVSHSSTGDCVTLKF